MHFLRAGKDLNLHSRMATVLQTADFTHLPSDPYSGSRRIRTFGPVLTDHHFSKVVL